MIKIPPFFQTLFNSGKREKDFGEIKTENSKNFKVRKATIIRNQKFEPTTENNLIDDESAKTNFYERLINTKTSNFGKEDLFI